MSDSSTAVGEALGLSSSPPPATAVPAVPAPVPKAAGSVPGATKARRKPAALKAAAKPAPIPVEVIAPEPEPVPFVEPRAAAEAAPAPIVVNKPSPANEHLPIYSHEDRDVTPARLLSEQQAGPLFRGLQADKNTMELIISPQGKVEQVRLTSPTKRMTDMLLLSGAKTWTFSPALKEGQPVRYRTLFTWEMTP